MLLTLGSAPPRALHQATTRTVMGLRIIAALFFKARTHPNATVG